MLAKKFALGFGIAIIFPMTIHYGVSTFVHEPKWQDYQVENYYQRYEEAIPEQKAQLWEEQSRLEKQRKESEKHFQKYLFVVAIPLGVIAIIVGSISSIQAIGTGLMFGGIFSLVDGYFNYWSELADAMKFLTMLAAFIVLVFIGYRKLAK